MSAPTIKSLILALQGLFLVRVHGDLLFLEDLGLAHELDPIAMQDVYRSGFQWIFLELRAQVAYRPEVFLECKSFRSRGGAWVPFVLRLRNGNTLLVTWDSLPFVGEKSLKSVWSAVRQMRIPLSKAKVIHLHAGNDTEVLKKGAWVLPARALA